MQSLDAEGVVKSKDKDWRVAIPSESTKSVELVLWNPRSGGRECSCTPPTSSWMRHLLSLRLPPANCDDHEDARQARLVCSKECSYSISEYYTQAKDCSMRSQGHHNSSARPHCVVTITVG